MYIVRWLCLFRGKEYRDRSRWSEMLQWERDSADRGVALSAEFFPETGKSSISGAMVGLASEISDVTVAYDGDVWTERSGEKYQATRGACEVRRPKTADLKMMHSQRGHTAHCECLLSRPTYHAVVVRERASKNARALARFIASRLGLPIIVIG